MRTFLIIIFISFLFGFKSRAQSDSSAVINDSIEKAKIERKKIYSSPRKASIMSAILPGLGQAYNKKYWKIPVIYAAVGGFSYMFYVNNSEYNNYRRALKESINNGTGKAEVAGNVYFTDDLQTQKLSYRKFRDFAGIGIGIVYLLNIIDANVDAHLRTFDVSDDLSLRIDPYGTLNTFSLRPATGLSLKLTFK